MSGDVLVGVVILCALRRSRRLARWAGGLTVVAVLAVAAALMLNGTHPPYCEMPALRRIKDIQHAQAVYRNQFGAFATRLEDSAILGLVPNERLSRWYRFTMTATPNGYAIHAEPVEYGRGGRRSFYSDETLVIRENWDRGPASSASAELR